MEIKSEKQFIIITLSDFEKLVHNVAERISSKPDVNREIPTTKYLTRKEVSTLLHVDLSTLWRWEKAGILVARHTGAGGRVLYDFDSVEALVKHHER